MKCNNCKSDKIKKYRIHSGNTLLKCGACDLIFINKMPRKNTLLNYYGDTFYVKENSERFGRILEWILAQLRYLRIRSIRKFCKHSGKMVDVGFSRGTTMKLLKSGGWQTFGTQISINAYKNAKRKGLDVFLGELESAKIESSSIELVTFWHVLEHLRNPCTYLRETNRILNNNGKLIIEVPNIGSPIAQFFREKWLGLDLPRHLYHFSDRSLSSILKNNGFIIMKRDYFSFEQSIFSSLQSILNLFNTRNNVFFDTIKKNKKVNFFLKGYNWILAGIFILPSSVLAFSAGLLHAGDIMRYYCIKVKNVSDK